MNCDNTRKIGISVTDIMWDHIYLHLKVKGKKLENYDYYVSGLQKNKYPIEYANGELCLNIMNVPEIEVLPAGKWFLAAVDKQTGHVEPVGISAECGYRLEDMDKIYRYASGACAYAVSFAVLDGLELKRQIQKTSGDLAGYVLDDERLYLQICTDYFRKEKSDGKQHPLNETHGIVGSVKGMALIAARIMLNGIYQLLCVFARKDGKHILLLSEMRTQAGGNLAALGERLKERGLDGEYTITYSYSKILEQKKVHQAKKWLKLVSLIARQDFVFVDDYVPIFQSIHLRKNTKLVQLWHAGVGFKAVGYARFGRSGSPHPQGTCHRRYDYVVVGAKGLIPVYEEVFGVPKEKILPLGLPRMDQYLTGEHADLFRKQFYQKYSSLVNKKLILFAPTYRGTGQRDAYYPWDKIDFQAVYDMCGETYVFALKMHPFVTDLPEISEKLRNRIIAFSSEEDINELFYVTEILITDFSSNIYEFSIQNKPMIFYAFDKDYYQLTRGVHRKLDEFAPGKICETFDEVVRTIKTEDFEQEKREKFVKSSFDAEAGNASDRIIDKIILDGTGKN